MQVVEELEPVSSVRVIGFRECHPPREHVRRLEPHVEVPEIDDALDRHAGRDQHCTGNRDLTDNQARAEPAHAETGRSRALILEHFVHIDPGCAM